ncbi:MAG: hypothetical protein D3906_11400, partial [Candidatus Electrothrix sp. AUS1_2]|nr:hypothetical protein [Candidatus Electrothrix sp. AUS1_2]
YIYMPDVMGYGCTLGLIALSMALWYIIVTWNEESNKLIAPSRSRAASRSFRKISLCFISTRYFS